MAYDNVVYDVKDGVATITLNRPDAYNALNFRWPGTSSTRRSRRTRAATCAAS